MKENAVGLIKPHALLARLLIIMNHRSRTLEVNHETQVRFIETHSERDSGDQDFQIVVKQPLLKFLSLLTNRLPGYRCPRGMPRR